MDEAERTAILQREIARWTRRGFIVESQTDTTAQMRRPKKFSFLTALLGLLFLVVGLFIYLFWYMSKRDQVIFITVDEQGNVDVEGLPWTLWRFVARRFRRRRT